MAYNPNLLQLTGVLQQLYRRLGAKVTTATAGGDNNTVIDTKLEEDLGEGNEDDIFNGGTVIVSNTGDGAAPIGEFSRITDYVSSTKSLELSPNLSAGVDSGDSVIIAPPDFPLYDMIEVVNDSLKYLGEVPVPDVSLTTALDQTEYLLPAAATGNQLLDLEIQTVLGDPNNQGFVPIENWRIVPASSVGGQSTLVVPQFGAGYLLRVTYLGVHPRVTVFDSNISGYLHPDLIHAVVFAHVVQWLNDRAALTGGADDATLALEQKAWSQVDRARIMHPVMIPPRRIHGMPHFTPGGGRLYNLLPPYSWLG